MDIWGSIYKDHFEGRVHPHVIERDDGVASERASAEAYFKAPRSEGEREALDALDGPVLDLGAGPGSHALYLEGRGREVTAIDSSPGAIEICRRRCCRDARVMDLRNLTLPADHYAAFIAMGNTLGVHQSPETLPAFLRRLADAGRPGARLLCSMPDPLATDDPLHLRYHQRNRDRGLPAGLSVIRLRYRGLVDDWVSLWMPTDEELQRALADSGWALVDEKAQGSERLRLLQRT